MGKPKSVAVVGFKDAGKTKVVETLVAELSSRGYRVGTIKHTIDKQPFDKEGSDTYRHEAAGAEASAIISSSRAAIFLQNPLTLFGAVDALGDVDYIILEGFKTTDFCSRIIVPRRQSEVSELSNGLEILAIKIDDDITAAVPVMSLSNSKRFADIVEEMAFPLLAGLNCGVCGYQNCREMGQAILQKKADPMNCVKYKVAVRVKVNGKPLVLNNFTQTIFRNVVLSLVRSMKDSGEPTRVEVEIDE